MKKLIKVISNINIVLGIVLTLIPIIVVVLSTFSFISKDSDFTISARVEKENEILSTSILDSNMESSQLAEFEIIEQIDIPSNTAVTYGNTVRVPKIGVDTAIYEGMDSVISLEKGVWRMPDWSTPTSEGTMILAAHRWGMDSLSSEYRNKNLFLKLPDLREGDEIFVTWNGVEHKYVINHMEENVYVSRLEDLILITCKYYNSPERIFVFAEKVY